MWLFHLCCCLECLGAIDGDKMLKLYFKAQPSLQWELFDKDRWQTGVSELAPYQGMKNNFRISNLKRREEREKQQLHVRKDGAFVQIDKGKAESSVSNLVLFFSI